MEDSNIFFDSINNINENLIYNNNQLYNINTDPFNKAIENMKNIFDKIIITKKINNLNFIQEVVDDNLYVASYFKQSKKDKSLYNIPKLSDDNNNHLYNKKKEDNNRVLLKEDNYKVNINNKKSYYNQNNNNNTSFNESYLNKKQNDLTNFYNINPNNNDYIINEKKDIEGISSHINIPDNLNNNNLANINSNINKNLTYIGKKRNNEDINENENESIVSEIKNIYNKIRDIYNQNANIDRNNDKLNIKIFENRPGFFVKNETLMIDNNPICILYFNHDLITSIFLIKENKKIEESKDIKFILKLIMNKLKK